MARDKGNRTSFFGTVDRIQVGSHAEQILEILQFEAVTQAHLCAALHLRLGELLQVLEVLELRHEIRVQCVRGTWWVHRGDGRRAVA